MNNNALKLRFKKDELPSESALYREMFERNTPIIDWSVQTKVSEIKLAVAGCGSTGGAFTDGAVRLGVVHYKFADQGRYELNNLNRQMVDSTKINENKAMTYASRVQDINPLCMVETYETGLNEKNMDEFLQGATLVFDAVDVTTSSGMKAKFLLHERAAKWGLPVASALDLGFTQWIKGYNYKPGEKALEGRIDEARRYDNPIVALLKGFISVDELPLEIIDEVLRLINNPEASACQLGSACFLLSALVSPYLIHFVKEGTLPELVQVDLLPFFMSPKAIEAREGQARRKRRDLLKAIGL